jgi:hypothetical protein
MEEENVLRADQYLWRTVLPCLNIFTEVAMRPTRIAKVDHDSAASLQHLRVPKIRLT